LEKASVFYGLRARTHARTLVFFQRKICTSVTARCKLLPDNEIDRCRCGDNSDRYSEIWHKKLHFFEEKVSKKIKNVQNWGKEQQKSPVFTPKIGLWGQE